MLILLYGLGALALLLHFAGGIWARMSGAVLWNHGCRAWLVP